MYRKFKPSALFNGTETLPADSVLIAGTDGSITAIVKAADAGDDIEILDGTLCPAFINCHCHIELSHLKGLIPEHTGLVGFVQQVMTGRQADVLLKQEAMQKAEKELYDSGTVAVGDICNGTDSLGLKKTSRLYWHNFIEVSGFVDTAAEKRLAAATLVLEAFRKGRISGSNPQSSTLSPHAPYSVSKKLFGLLNEQTTGQVISIHNQEAAAENQLYESKSGPFLGLYENFGIDISGFQPSAKTSMQTWLPYFSRQQRVIAVHNTCTTSLDPVVSSQIAALHFCICINANLYIENTLPPLEMLLSRQTAIVVGTDSYASNHQLNMFEEIRSIRRYFPQLPLETILQWSTLNGAKALGIEKKYGSFEKGKQPGIVLINRQNTAASRLL